MPLAPFVYCNKVDELIVFPSKKAALEWMEKNHLDTSDTSILVPFKDRNNEIRFLKPINPNNLLTTKHDAVNNNIRIMGADNSIHIHGFINWFEDKYTANRVPHLNELEGDSINLVEHGFIVIYEKGERKVGHQFATLFKEEKQSLIDKIKTAQTNEEPHIKEDEFLEKLSQLALGLDIKGGMSYFVTKDKEGNQHVYRHTFKQDSINEKIANYLKEEKNWHESKHINIKEHKSKDHHISQFSIDCGKYIFFAAITAIGAGLILGIFITPPIGPIAAAVVAIATFVGLASLGLAKAEKNNPTTIVFGTPEFEVESEATFFSSIKERINSLHDLFNSKAIKTATLSVENNDNGVSASPVGIFTTIVSSTINIPARNSTSRPFITKLVNSSLSLFTFQQDNKLIKDNGLESSSPSLKN